MEDEREPNMDGQDEADEPEPPMSREEAIGVLEDAIELYDYMVERREDEMDVTSVALRGTRGDLRRQVDALRSRREEYSDGE